MFERSMFGIVGMSFAFVAGTLSVLWVGGMAAEHGVIVVTSFMLVGLIVGVVLPTGKASIKLDDDFHRDLTLAAVLRLREAGVFPEVCEDDMNDGEPEDVEPSEYDLYWNALKESTQKEVEGFYPSCNVDEYEACVLAEEAVEAHQDFDVEEEAAAYEAGQEMWAEATEAQRETFNMIDVESMSWSEQADMLQEILEHDDYMYESYQLTHIWWKNIPSGPMSVRLADHIGVQLCPKCSSSRYFTDGDECWDCGDQTAPF